MSLNLFLNLILNPKCRLNHVHARRIENPINNSASLGDCRESLTIYDSSWTEGRAVVKTFCDGFSRPLEKHDFVSTGGALTVRDACVYEVCKRGTMGG